MSHKVEFEELIGIKSVTPYRATFRRPTVWLIQKVDCPIAKIVPISTSPALGGPARELESTDSDSHRWAA